MTEDHPIFRALNFIRDNAPAYAKAKAERVYLENFRKSKKAMLMQKAETEGYTSAALQERQAYADPEYIELLSGLQVAVEEEEKYRWLMTGAELKIEVHRTMEASRRAEAKNL